MRFFTSKQLKLLQSLPEGKNLNKLLDQHAAQLKTITQSARFRKANETERLVMKGDLLQERDALVEKIASTLSEAAGVATFKEEEPSQEKGKPIGEVGRPPKTVQLQPELPRPEPEPKKADHRPQTVQDVREMLRGKQTGKGDKGPGKGKDKGKDRQRPDKGKSESDDHHDDADDADADGRSSNPPILALSPFKAQVQKAVWPCEQMQADMARVLGKNSSAAALRAGDENEDDKENEAEDDEDVMPDNSTGADSSGSLAKRARQETNAPASASPCGCNEWFPRIVLGGMHSGGNAWCELCGSTWSF